MKKNPFAIMHFISIPLFIILLSLGCVFSAEPEENVKAFLKNLETTVNNMDTYTFVVTSENWKEERYKKNVVKFYFKKPGLIRSDVIGGKKKGSAVLLNKEGKIRGKNSWGFKKTLKPDDNRLRNMRGSTFMDASLLNKTKKLKGQILKKRYSATLKEERYEGKGVYYLYITHKSAEGVVKDEHIWFDREKFVMLKNIKYENGEKASETTWRDFQINIPLDDELFEM